jgi:hypothetical protein
MIPESFVETTQTRYTHPARSRFGITSARGQTPNVVLEA